MDKKCINNKQKSQTQLWRLAKGMRREMYEINELITEEGRSTSGPELNEEVHRFMTELGNPEKGEGSFFSAHKEGWMDRSPAE